MTLASNLRHQFGKPEVLLGRFAGWIMTLRPSKRERNRWTVDLLKITPGDRVLEIGHGPGLSIAQAAGKMSSARVVGIDHSAVMHGQASTRNAALIRGGTVDLRLGGFELLATLPGPFDKVFAVNVLQFLPDHQLNDDASANTSCFPAATLSPIGSKR